MKIIGPHYHTTSLPQLADCFFNKMHHSRPLFVYFRLFLNPMTNIVKNLTINGKSLDDVLGIQTRDHRIVGAIASTELWHPLLTVFSFTCPSRQSMASLLLVSINNSQPLVNFLLHFLPSY